MALLFEIALIAALAALAAAVVLAMALPSDRPGPRLTLPPGARAPREARGGSEHKVIHLFPKGQARRTQGT